MAEDMLWGAVPEPGKGGNNTTNIGNNRQPTNELGKDAFMQLLIAQMRNQDPLNPMEDKEFLAQMAQFTSLEQMNNLNDAFETSQAYSMIGKGVEAKVLNQASGLYRDVKGVVESVRIENGKTILEVEGVDVPLESVTKVHPNMIDGNNWGNINNGMSQSQAMGMIGKTIQAITMDPKGNPTGFVEGKVDFVKLIQGIPVLVVGDEEIFLNEILSVAGDNMIIGKDIEYMVKDEATGEMVVKSGEIESIILKDKKAYMVIDGEEVHIDKIDMISEALRRVDRETDYKGFEGTVDRVLVKNGQPYLIIKNEAGEEKEVSFKEYLKEKGTNITENEDIDDEDEKVEGEDENESENKPSDKIPYNRYNRFTNL